MTAHVGPWRRWLSWALLAVAVIAGVMVVNNRQNRIDDLESRNQALETRAAAEPGAAAAALARVSARAAVADENARDMIRAVQLQQGRIEELNRRVAAGQTPGAIAAGRLVATCQVAAVRASSAASSVANALSGLALVGPGGEATCSSAPPTARSGRRSDRGSTRPPRWTSARL